LLLEVIVIVVSLPSFDLKLTNWMKKIDANAIEVAKKGKSDYSDLYGRAFQSFLIFSPLIEQLPKDQTTWATGEELLRPRETDVHFAFESLIQGIFLASCNLWSPSNHSARCALEQMLITIHSIGYPVDFQEKEIEKDEDPSIQRIRDVIEKIFKIPQFSRFNKHYKTEMEKKAGERILPTTEVRTFEGYINKDYHNLSFYVHTSNLQISMNGATPHLTENLSFNKKFYDDTIDNLNRTLDILIILLFVTNIRLVTKDHIDQLNKVTSKHVFDTILKFWASNQKRKP
jgi:hypothetical protein